MAFGKLGARGGFGSAGNLGRAGIPRTQPDPLLTSPYRIVLPRGQLPQEYAAGSGGTRDRNLIQLLRRTRAVAPKSVRVVIANCGISNNSGDNHGEIAPATAVTFRCFEERMDTGEILQYTFDGGSTAGKTLQPFEIAVSDPIDASQWAGGSTRWPANKAFSYHQEALGPAVGCNIPSGFRADSSITNSLGVSGTRSDQNVWCDVTLGANQVAAAGAYTTTGGDTNTAGCPPCGFVGDYVSGDVGFPACYWMGDSISDLHLGLTQHNIFAATSGIDGNFIQQALRQLTYPYTQGSLASAQPLRGYNTGVHALTTFMMKYVSHFIMQPGTNELQSGYTAAQIYAWEKVVIQDGLARGIKKFITLPITPRVITTNSLVDAAGQDPGTIFGSGGEKDALNALRLAGAGQFDGPDYFIDTAGTVQDAGDTHKWLTDGTNFKYGTDDGASAPGRLVLHPRNDGHFRMKSPLVTAGGSWTL